MKPGESRTVAFGDCTLDLDRRELRRGGQLCHLSPRAFALLELLVAERPRALAKDDLRRRLWPETYVSNTGLAQLVTEVRKAVGDEARAGRWIRTVFGFGYAFAGEAVEEGGGASATPAVGVIAACWLRWGRDRLTLAEGENVVGRGREADVRLPLAEVSRRHARIVVTGGQAAIEDLGSRNGTFVRGRRVEGPTRLDDGAEVGIGPVKVVFFSGSQSTTTKVRRRRR